MSRIIVDPQWKRSSNQIWEEHFEEQTKSRAVVHHHVFKKWIYYSSAAVLAIILGISISYHREFTSNNSVIASIELPDGSQVSLNAGSVLSYSPLLWMFKREVKLDGEARFTVVKGEKFVVKTYNGDVRVLGTQFNVYSRNRIFEVSCYSGRVMVTTLDTVFLEKGDFVSLEDGALAVQNGAVSSELKGWADGYISFERIPLQRVLNEIEINYGVNIDNKDTNDYIYTGNFIKPSTAGEALEIILSPYGLYAKIGEDGRYYINK